VEDDVQREVKCPGLLFLLLLFFLPMCGGTDEVGETAPFYFATVADTHLWPLPEHPSNQRFMETGRRLSEHAPPIDMVFSLGDNVHDLFSPCPEGEPVPILDLYREMIRDAFALPFYIVLGNHDDRFLDIFLGQERPKDAWLAAFSGSSSLPSTYYRVDHKGFSFIVLDATAEAYDHDSNDRPTFGQEQLAWLERQLDRGVPTFLFWHHFVEPPPPLTEDTRATHPYFHTIYDYRTVVKAVFMGHGHQFRKFQWEGVMFYETTSLAGEEEPGFHLVACDPGTGTFRIHNEEEIIYREEGTTEMAGKKAPYRTVPYR
jgi:3',5'-cyclic AMP phosphodiesterase CpdA